MWIPFCQLPSVVPGSAKLAAESGRRTADSPSILDLVEDLPLARRRHRDLTDLDHVQVALLLQEPKSRGSVSTTSRGVSAGRAAATRLDLAGALSLRESHAE